MSTLYTLCMNSYLYEAIYHTLLPMQYHLLYCFSPRHAVTVAIVTTSIFPAHRHANLYTVNPKYYNNVKFSSNLLRATSYIIVV